MSANLVTVEQAAEQLHLHPKTVLRYIRDGRLLATRVGKSYRIARAKLDAFAGVTSNPSEMAVAQVRATCIIDIPNISVGEAERIATFLQASALSGRDHSSPLHLQTTFDPLAKSMKVVLIGSPSDVTKMLEMLQTQISAHL